MTRFTPGIGVAAGPLATSCALGPTRRAYQDVRRAIQLSHRSGVRGSGAPHLTGIGIARLWRPLIAGPNEAKCRG